MLKAVIFDFDGVIVNSEPLHYQVEKEMFLEKGIDISYQEYCEYAGISEAETYQLLAKKYGVALDANIMLPDKIERFIKMLDSLDDLPVIEGVEELIKDLHKHIIKLCVATSGTYQIAEAILKKLELWRYFEFVIAGNQLEKAKPDPEIFNRCRDRLGFDNTECLIIEDSINGIRGGIAANIPVIALNYKKELTDRKVVNVNNLNLLNFEILKEQLDFLT